MTVTSDFVPETEKKSETPVKRLASKIIQVATMYFPAGPNNGDCNKLVALCKDGSLWEQWHSMGYSNVPNDGLWYPNYAAHPPRR
jgi:hypothetical protein